MAYPETEIPPGTGGNGGPGPPGCGGLTGKGGMLPILPKNARPSSLSCPQGGLGDAGGDPLDPPGICRGARQVIPKICGDQAGVGERNSQRR